MLCMTNTRIANRAGRHLVLIDIENIAATPSPSEAEVVCVLRALADAIPGFSTAQRVWVSSHRAALAVGCAAPGDRRLWRSGRDGADLALLEVMDSEHLAERFERVTVCSGDGIFADGVARLAGQGVSVAVIALRGHLATRLRLAAHRVDYMAETAVTLGSAS